MFEGFDSRSLPDTTQSCGRENQEEKTQRGEVPVILGIPSITILYLMFPLYYTVPGMPIVLYLTLPLLTVLYNVHEIPPVVSASMLPFPYVPVHVCILTAVFRLLYKSLTMGDILRKIEDIEYEMSKTQKNKATSGHLGSLKAKLAKLRRRVGVMGEVVTD